ncbi:MAG: DUF922 domain-containing protein [Rubrivivax sp.]|nr:DUF922 domain-containing protein [Rubrivivax sp.]
MNRSLHGRLPGTLAEPAPVRGPPAREAAVQRRTVRRAGEATPGADFASVPLSRRLEIGDPADAVVGLQGGDAMPAEKKAAPKAADCAEKLTWVPVSPVPTDIRADTALEFAAGVDAVLGAGGHTHVSVTIKPTVEGGRMKQVGLTLESSIIRPRWAGGRPSESEKQLIKRVEAFIKAHEERHRDLSRSVMQQAVCDALGKPVAEAEKILKHATCELEPAAQEQLDAAEGQLQWVKDASGAVVDFKAVGATHDYHVAGCDPFAAPPQDESGDAGKDGED